MPSAKTFIYVPSMTLFQNKSFLFYKSKSIGQSLISTCFYQVPCVFVHSEFPGFHRRLRTPFDTFMNFHRWIHMSNKEYRVFHPRGCLSLLAMPNTRIFYFLFLLCDREAHFGRCPILPSLPSNTKLSVDLLTMHSHPFYAMSQRICNARCHCMLYHVTCTMNATWKTLLMYISNASWTIITMCIQLISIQHFIHVNISCKHISTFTFNMSFYDQAMTHTQKQAM